MRQNLIEKKEFINNIKSINNKNRIKDNKFMSNRKSTQNPNPIKNNPFNRLKNPFQRHKQLLKTSSQYVKQTLTKNKCYPCSTEFPTCPTYHLWHLMGAWNTTRPTGSLSSKWARIISWPLRIRISSSMIQLLYLEMSPMISIRITCSPILLRWNSLRRDRSASSGWIMLRMLGIPPSKEKCSCS